MCGGMQPIHGEESQAGGLGDAGPIHALVAQVQGVRLQRLRWATGSRSGSFLRCPRSSAEGWTMFLLLVASGLLQMLTVRRCLDADITELGTNRVLW